MATDTTPAIYSVECVVADTPSELRVLCSGRRIWDGPFTRTYQGRRYFYAYVDAKDD